MSSDVVYTLDEILAESEVYGTELKPLLIFEGKTDVGVYYKVLDKSSVNIDEIEIVIGGCKKNIHNFHKEGNDIKYLALLDLDYCEIFNEKLEDKNILYTYYYDMENYLTNIDVIHSTYEDFSDLRTKKLDKKQLLNQIIEVAYPSILESEFKIKYLKKYSKDALVYKAGIVKPQNTKFRSLTKEEKCIEVKKIISRFFEENKIKFDNELWDETIKYVEKKLDNCSIYDIDEYIQKLLKGRNIMDIERIVFDDIFKTDMKGKSKPSFIVDLKKNIFKSNKCELLLTDLDKGLKYMIS